MRLLKRRLPPHGDRVRALAEERLSTVSTGEVTVWCESAINGFHQNLDAYRSRNDQTALEELRKSVSLLSGALDVLEKRNRS